jgi:RNA polymerase sigma-70 factor (ECF subfamily)
VAEPWADLFRRARDGDTEAFGALIDGCFDGAWAVALGVTGSPSDAEDVCQDAFVRAWQRLHQCRDASGFRGWLVAVVRSVALNRRASVQRRVLVPLDEGMATESSDPARYAQQSELRRDLEGAVGRLSPAQRQVLLLHDLEGFRHREIAALMDISEAMSRRHLCDARARLRDLLAVHTIAEG